MNLMEQKEFAEQIEAQFNNITDYAYSTSVISANKNGIDMYGVQIGDYNAPIKICIYVDSYSNMTVEEAAKAMLDTFLNTPKINFRAEDFTWDKIKDNLSLYLVNQDRNNGSGLVLRTLDNTDLAIGVKYDMDGCHLKLRVEHLDHLGVTEDEIFAMATIRTAENATIQRMSAITLLAPAAPMLVVTNSDLSFGGASAILIPDILEQVKAELGDDFIVIPSSLNEVICIPNMEMNAEYMLSMVKAVNNTQLAPEDVLSYSIYRYDAESEQIVTLLPGIAA